VKGEKHLEVTSGSIRGFPRAWRRQFGHPLDTRPSLLFMDLPHPLSPDSTSSNLAAGSILDMVKENNRALVPVGGLVTDPYTLFNNTVSLTVALFLFRSLVIWMWKTRAVLELLSQHWGFYFNASSDDWGRVRI